MSAAAKDPLAGHPGHLTQEHKAALQQFKQELAAEGFYDPEKHDDAMLLRFLRARKFDIPKAKVMWIDTQKWKQSFHVDELYETFDYSEKAQVDKLYPRFYHKTDNDGRPVYIEQLGKLDLNELYKVTTPERQMQSLVVEYEKFQRERLPICSELQGHVVETSCTIMDLKGVGVSQFWKVKGYVQEASTISQNNYPESMGKFYIINAPWAFSTVWSLVKGWLDEATVAKIHILGSGYKDDLLKQVPASSLPKFLGGTCDCPEGCSLSDAGPWHGKSKQETVRALDKLKKSVSVERGDEMGRIAPPGQDASVVPA
ncbi:putative SEC14-phosphatidylinositol/phosphatidylcholine transfer protein [Rhodotorula diobovata]|uniref:Putative SEC14-phosphatidylinositol/phosphatidylcholine transfer protein n=1 Tax=Rhodotorula diobovata TaxID=5288 RepID=A0A5C5G487_9BASI|nr:putative SEC14-phosphatidylinositol/phosphatidylcholine transfer protein [Rhodotorula diobovata]